MTCHVTNQINQHMAERDNDIARENEALRDKCDELEDAIAGFAQLVGESSNESVAMLKGVESRYIALEAERDAYKEGCESAKRDASEWYSKRELNQTEKINLRAERDRLQSTVAALERERDEARAKADRFRDCWTKAEQEREEAEEALRLICICATGNDPSEGEGTSPDEIRVYAEEAICDRVALARQVEELKAARIEELISFSDLVRGYRTVVPSLWRLEEALDAALAALAEPKEGAK